MQFLDGNWEISTVLFEASWEAQYSFESRKRCLITLARHKYWKTIAAKQRNKLVLIFFQSCVSMSKHAAFINLTLILPHTRVVPVV